MYCDVQLRLENFENQNIIVKFRRSDQNSRSPALQPWLQYFFTLNEDFWSEK